MNHQLQTFIFIVMFFLANNLLGQEQDISIQIGESDKKGLFDGINGVVAQVDDGFYVLRMKTKGSLLGSQVGNGSDELYLDKYSNDLKFQSTVDIDGIVFSVAGRSRGAEYEFCLQDDQDNVYVYFSEFRKGVNSLYRIRLDESTGSFVDEQTIYRDQRANKRLDRRGSYSLVESVNRNTFAIYSFVNERNANYTEVYAAVFKRNMELLWEMNENIEGYARGESSGWAFQSSYRSLESRNLSISVSNAGVLNIMRVIYDNKLFAGLTGDYYHIIYTLSGPDNRVDYRLFDFEDSFILQALIRHDQNDELNLVGYMGDNRRRIDGVVFINMNASNLETTNTKSIKLTDSQKEAFLVSSDADSVRKQRGDERTKRRIDKGKNVGISSSNRLINAYVHQDNSTTVVSEYFDVITSTNNIDGNMNTTTTFVFGDLKYINIGSDGNIRWVKNIHKNQRSSLSLIHI